MGFWVLGGFLGWDGMSVVYLLSCTWVFQTLLSDGLGREDWLGEGGLTGGGGGGGLG